MPESPYDGEEYPHAEDLDGVWHRRPPTDVWTQAEIAGGWVTTVCGRRVETVHVSGCGIPVGRPACPECTDRED